MTKVLIIATMFVGMTLAPSRMPAGTSSIATEVIQQNEVEKSSQTGHFYRLRPDLRKCASPMCGGYFVRAVNQPLTRCANGRKMSECYVTAVNWNGAQEVEVTKALISGNILTRGDRNGKYGVLSVNDVWQAANDDSFTGEFYKVRDLGVRCITAPCESHQESKLNTNQQRKIAGVEISGVQASDSDIEEAFKILTGDGLIVAGNLVDVTGPAGRSKTLKATQFFLPQASSSTLKPCIRTGCSQQICSDEQVITTCEYKPEYDCYKKAACERQADGNCGFTKTTELASCLSKGAL